MPCNQLQDAACASAIGADSLTPNTSAGVFQLVNSSNMNSWFSVYQNNIQGFNGNADAESGVSFNLAPFLGALCKAYELTGDPLILADMESRIDQIWAMNDQAVVASGVQVPDANGSNGSIVPYEACATPAGFDLNTPYCGWSRWAPNFLSSSCPAARARPELLTDGVILGWMMEAIQCMKDCGALNPTKSAQWFSKIKQILDVWDVEWQEGVTTTNSNMGPLCSGTQQYTVTGQYIDMFGKTYPINQQLAILNADLLYQECTTDRTGAKERAAKIITDINNQYFVTSGGVDQGWYYTLFCNCVETIEDMGHALISLKFMKAATECGVSGSAATLERMLDTVKNNAYQGAGDFAWYVDGNVSHGTLASNVSSGPWGSTAVGSCSPTQSYSSGSGGSPQLFIGTLILSDLPEPLNTQCKSYRDASMAAWRAADSTVATGEELNAVFCYMQSLCERPEIIVEPEPEPEPDCIDGTPASVSVGSGGCADGIPLSVSVSGDDTCIEPGADDTCIDPDNSGSNQIVTQTRYSPKDCNQVCCTDGGLDTAIVWCNWCTLKGSTVTATSAENGTDPRMTCECESGVYWQFVSRATYTVELDKEFSFDSVILSNHNLCEAGATIRILADGNPVKLMSHTNSEAIISVDDCDRHGFKCSCNDIAMYLPECKLASKVEIEIESDGLRKIGNITVGISTELTLEPNQSNPFDASHQIADFKTSGKCIYPPSIKDVGVEFDAVFTGLYSEYVDTELKPMFTYATRYPVHFAMSRTTLPNQVGRAIIRTRESSTFGNTPCKKSLTIPMTIFINGC